MKLKKGELSAVPVFVSVLFFLIIFHSHLCYAEMVNDKLEKGKNAFNSGYYKEAIGIFMDVLAEDPSNISAKRYLKKTGKIIIEADARKHLEEKEKLLKEVKEFEKKDKLEKEVQLHVDTADKYTSENNLAGAELEYKKAIKLDPENELAKYGLLDIERKRKEVVLQEEIARNREKEAAQQKSELQKAQNAKQTKKEIEIRIKAATVAFGNKELFLAETECKNVLKLQPDNKEANDLLEKIGEKQKQISGLLNEASRTLKNNQLITANDRFNQVLEIEPENEKAKKGIMEIQNQIRTRMVKGDFSSLQNRYYTEGFYYYNKKDYAKAVSSWERAQTLEKSGISSSAFDLQSYEIEEYVTRTKNLMTSKADKEKAKKSFDSGMSAYKNKRYSSATKYFREAFKLDPVLTEADKMLKESESAMQAEASRKPIAKEDTPPSAALVQESDKYYNQGLVFYASGQVEDAIKQWEVALRINPNHSKAKRALDKAKYDLEEDRK